MSLAAGMSGAPLVQFTNSIAGTGKAEFYTLASANRITSATTTSDGEWHNIAWVHDRETTTKALYVDGELQGANAGGVVNWDNWGWVIGAARSPGAGYYNGRIDEVSIYSRALSAQAIRDHVLMGQP